MSVRALLVIPLAIYFAAAAGGFLSAGGLRKFRFAPRLDEVSLKWRGIWALPARILSIVGWLLILWGYLLLSFAMFLFLSPLLALTFFNQMTGRPPPHGALARWYERLAEQRWKDS
ncbi:MAG TPA: hypothetical protein VMV15_03555 [Candidatus Binataceae bacterium]|nr:hypothetical protein [Candidatus Binataceae bacterium]